MMKEKMLTIGGYNKGKDHVKSLSIHLNGYGCYRVALPQLTALQSIILLITITKPSSTLVLLYLTRGYGTYPILLLIAHQILREYTGQY